MRIRASNYLANEVDLHSSNRIL